MHYAYDPAADSIMAENEGDFLSEDELIRRVSRARVHLDEI